MTDIGTFNTTYITPGTANDASRVVRTSTGIVFIVKLIFNVITITPKWTTIFTFNTNTSDSFRAMEHNWFSIMRYDNGTAYSYPLRLTDTAIVVQGFDLPTGKYVAHITYLAKDYI